MIMQNFKKETLGKLLQLWLRNRYMKILLLLGAGYFIFLFGKGVGEFLFYITR